MTIQPHVSGMPECYVISADGNVNSLDFPEDSLAICIKMKNKRFYQISIFWELINLKDIEDYTNVFLETYDDVVFSTMIAKAI